MRIALAVIAGYVVMAAGLIGASFGILFGLGEHNQFQTGTLDVAPIVCILMLAAGILAGLLGGFVAAKIAQTSWRAALVWLIGLIFVLGMLSAAGDWTRARALAEKTYSAEEIADMSFQERAKNATKPMWFSFIIPLIGAASAVLGCRLSAPTLRQP